MRSLIGAAAISPFYGWDRLGDVVLSIDGHVVARDKSRTILDCVDTPLDSSWWQHCINTSTGSFPPWSPVYHDILQASRTHIGVPGSQVGYVFVDLNR